MGEDILARRQELDRLRALLLATNSRTDTAPSMALIRGEPGIGKTHLLHTLCREAIERHFTVLLGTAGEYDSGVPFAALRDALGPALEGEHDPDLRRRAVTLARMLRLAERSREDHLGRVFAAVSDMMQRWARRGPILLALDDVHVTDIDTVRLLALLVRHLHAERVVLVLSYRPAEAPPDLSILSEMVAGEGLAEVIDLQPFDRTATATLIDRTLGFPPDDSLLDAVWDAARGNVYFLEETIRCFVEQDVLVFENGVAALSVPAAVATVTQRHTLIHRVFRLGPHARTVATVMTAFQRFGLRRLNLIAALCDLTPRQVEEAFDRLVAAGVLSPRTDGYEFQHAIVRHTLYEDIGPAQRRRIHSAIAAKLLEDPEIDTPLGVVEVATHVAVYAEFGDVEAAMHLKRAGDAIVHVAPSGAATWYERALRVLAEGHPDRPEIAASRARALYLGWHLQEVVEAADIALACPSSPSSHERTATLQAAALASLGRLDEALATTDAGLTGASSGSRLRAQRTMILVHLDRLAEAHREGRLVAVSDADDGTRTIAVGQLAAVAFARGDIATFRSLLDEQHAIAEQSGSDLTRLSALVTRAAYLSFGGLLGEARTARNSANEIAVDVGGAAFRGMFDLIDTYLDWLSGNWDTALERLMFVELDLERRNEAFALTLIRLARAALLTARGSYGEARRALDAIDQTPFATGLVAWSRAGLMASTGDERGALALLERARDKDRSNGRLATAPLLLAAIVDHHLARGHDAARVTARELEPFTDAGTAPWPRAVALRAVGLAYLSPDALRESCTVAREHGLMFEEALSLLALGGVGIDPEENLRAALSTFVGLRADPWRQRTARELRARGLSVPNRRSALSSALTTTEAEMARLVREGRSNREIAAVVHLSQKTVEAYLSRVYRKVGCSSRLELALAVEAAERYHQELFAADRD